MLVPPFHRAAQTRPGIDVRGAGKFIIAPRHGIQHVGGYATIHLLTLRGLLQVRHNACQCEACTGVSLFLIEHGDFGLWIKHQVRHHCYRRLIEPIAQIEAIGNRTPFWNSRSIGLFGSSCCDLVLRHQNLLSGCGQTLIENPLFDFHISNARIIFSGDSRIPSSINRTEASYRC